MAFLGYKWLIEKFGLLNIPLQHASEEGTRKEWTEFSDGRVKEVYPSAYAPGDRPLDHVQFALRYDGINLGLLQHVFRRIEPAEVVIFIQEHPTGKLSRIIGFLYELLTGIELNVSCGGNYVRVLDREKYFEGLGKRYPKWRVLNNLPGPTTFCPLVRKTPRIVAGLSQPWSERIRRVLRDVSPASYGRAVAYLYLKETRSSYAIEHESVSGDRQERFVAVLHRAGRNPLQDVLSERELTGIQKVIVDPAMPQIAFATNRSTWASGFRTIWSAFTTFALHPNLSGALWRGCNIWRQRFPCWFKPRWSPSDLFSFILSKMVMGGFIAFLLHDVLARGLMESGVILPVSASMLAHPDRYDRCLEQFSRQIAAFAQYTLNPAGEMTVTNPAELEPLYRYPDLTTQVEYFLDVLEDTVSHQLPNELDVLRGFDQSREAIRAVIDLPDRKLESLLQFLYNNHGRLSKAKRPQFQELTDDEVTRIEAALPKLFQEMRKRPVDPLHTRTSDPPTRPKPPAGSAFPCQPCARSSPLRTSPQAGSGGLASTLVKKEQEFRG